MAEYIEREALQRCRFIQDKWGEWILAEDIINLPAADVRPVVLCRDCKYWEISKIEPSLRVCAYVCGATFVRKAEDFCSRGEKREES